MTSSALPGDLAPDLELPRLGDGRWRLKDCKPDNFTFLLFYRGAHCPICKKQLEELNRKLGEFRARGVDVVTISCDDEARASRSRSEWKVDELPLVYELSLPKADQWGLYVSESIKEEEPRYFAEPGMFLVRPDGRLYASWLQSTPFARPRLDDVLDAIDFVTEKQYPARGSMSGERLRAAG